MRGREGGKGENEGGSRAGRGKEDKQRRERGKREGESEEEPAIITRLAQWA